MTRLITGIKYLLGNHSVTDRIKRHNPRTTKQDIDKLISDMEYLHHNHNMEPKWMFQSEQIKLKETIIHKIYNPYIVYMYDRDYCVGILTNDEDVIVCYNEMFMELSEDTQKVLICNEVSKIISHVIDR
jgi:hypothetical protein